MGRPREHTAATGVELLDAAEEIVATSGLGALSLRALADQVGTTTRAVYSCYGSKAGLIAALGARAFDLLGAAVQALPVTSDAAADLVEAGTSAFRNLVVEHPALFQLGIQRPQTSENEARVIQTAAARAWTVLQARVSRLQRQEGLGTRTVDEAATAFHALCEGMAALEIRGAIPAAAADRLWDSALTALVDGFNVKSTGTSVYV